MTPAEKLRAAFDLHTAGVRLMEQNLRRRHPEAGEEEIRHRLEAWLHERPGAEFGDCVGKVVQWRDREASLLAEAQADRASARAPRGDAEAEIGANLPPSVA